MTKVPRSVWHLSHLARFFSKFDIRDPDECWEWKACLTGGYGLFTMGCRSKTTPRSMFRAHRITYEIAKGPIPVGLEIDHLCRNRRCVNPYHLETVTRRENLIRSPITFVGINVAKTHCKRGHPLSGDNLWVSKRGERFCKACYKCRKEEHCVL